MPTETCAKCGAEISLDATGQFCPACLLESGLTSTENSADSSVATPSLDGMGRCGAYELLGEIARGGQGVVYRARHSVLQREVALKMIPHSAWTTEANIQRFRTEARVTAELDHPAIVPIYEIGEFHGQHYFTMKLIDGVSLNRLPSEQSLSQRRAAEIIAELARAAQHAHDRGILHRDIKPGNILLDTEGRPHLTDFGLAKLLESDSTLTQTIEVLGTPSYLAPELAAGNAHACSSATDVYGLGAVLYQLLTNNPPFAGGTTLETVRQVMENEPRQPRLWNSRIDRDLEVICLKCLEKDPARRYASAAALADDLDRWLHHEPIRARPGSLMYRARKWTRRHAVATTMVGGLIAVAGAIGVSVKYASAPADPYTLAVLLRPADDASKYLATEFSRDLVHSLDGLPGIRVAPRGEILRWEQSRATPEEVGKSIRVPTILAGSFQQTGDTFQFAVELIDVARGSRLWAHTYAENIAGGPVTQAQIVRAVSSALGIELTGKNRAALRPPLTTKPAAWMHYVRARQRLASISEPSLLDAVSEFEQAVAADPNFAEAYAGLANAHIDLGYTFRNPKEHFEKARVAVEQARQLDATFAETIIADGVLKFFLDWDWRAIDRAVRQAVLLDPSTLENHSCYLHALETIGRAKESLETVRLAFNSHPSSISIQAELGCASYYAGKFDDAAGYWREVIKNDPHNAYLHWGLGRTLAQLGNYAGAITEFATAQSEPSGDWTAIIAEQAYVHGREQRRDEVTRLVGQLRAREKGEFVDPYLYAMAYAGLGDRDEVFRTLDAAAACRSSWILNLPVDPKFAGMRDDPRYARLLALLNLPAR
jgi:tetratricopeptide (TPR) repeat protein/tRNA A-37 threonylcarbamoyl transferase component Bud32